MLKLASAAILIAIAAAPIDARDRNQIPIAIAEGKPVDCVQLSRVRETRVRSDQIIDFYMNGGTVYRNTLPYSCPRLGFEERFSYRTSIDQLCSVDTITVLEAPGLSQGPTCGLGTFQPVTITKPQR